MEVHTRKTSRSLGAPTLQFNYLTQAVQVHYHGSSQNVTCAHDLVQFRRTKETVRECNFGKFGCIKRINLT
jgi:hypothetical protein